MKLLILFLTLNISEPQEQVLKFYDWYLNAIETKEIYKLVSPENVEGQTTLRYQPYFDSLKQLNTFHEEFFKSELRAFQRCNGFLEQWTWENYQWEEPSYEGYCDFLDYHRWLWTQEPVTTVEVIEQSINGSTATVKIRALFINKTDKVIMNSGIIIQLKKDSNIWLITSIQS